MTKVVIVGGGYAGAGLAHALRNLPGLSLTLVDTKSYFENKIGVFRFITNPSLVSRNQGYHLEKLEGKVQVLSDSKLLAVRPGSIAIRQLEQSQQHDKLKDIPFDFLVLATGSSYRNSHIRELNSDVTQRRFFLLNDWSELAASAPLVAQAQTITVIGGGPAGVETAFDILETYPDKTVHIVHPHSALLNPQLPCKETQDIVSQHMLDNYGDHIKCHLGKRASSVDVSYGHVVLSDGTTIESQVAFLTAGQRYNTDYLEQSDEVFKHTLLPDGTIRVNEYLQVVSSGTQGQPDTVIPNVFAVGDIAGTGEAKLAKMTQKHTKSVAKNLVALAQSGTVSSQLIPYEPELRKKQTVLLSSTNAVSTKTSENGQLQASSGLKHAIHMLHHLDAWDYPIKTKDQKAK